MTRLVLRRLESSPLATFGYLTTDEGKYLAHTLELPWRDNAANISCIPAGTYTAHRRWSPKHHCDVFELIDVPGRSHAQLHVGNTVADTEGCILLGSGFGTIPTEGGDVKGVVRSKPAFERFMECMRGIDAITLTVTSVSQ